MTDENENLDVTIAENAAGPASMNVDGNSATQHPLPDQIAADKYLAAKRSQASPGLGLRFVKVIAPGI
jgi:hypothetical protein